MILKLKNYILFLLHPIIYLLSYVEYIEGKCPKSFIQKAIQIVQPGDIVLSRIDLNFVNLFIPGFYKHASLIINNIEIIESIRYGVVINHVERTLLKKDDVVILRKKNISKEESLKLADISLNFLSKPYDYYFSPSIDAFYCSELVDICYKSVFNTELVKPHIALGQNIIYPQDYRESNEFDIILESKDFV